MYYMYGSNKNINAQYNYYSYFVFIILCKQL